MVEMRKRSIQGTPILLGMVASLFREHLVQLAPEIEGVDYTELEISVIEGAADLASAVAVVLPSKPEAVASVEERMALWFTPVGDEPEPWVEVLAQWSPWPSLLVPMPTNRAQAKVVSRTLTTGEIEAMAKRLRENSAEILSGFSKAGRSVDSLGGGVVGTEIVRDITHSILRHELGVGERPKPHWGPALRRVRDESAGLVRQFAKYVETGRGTAFTLPDMSQGVTATEVQGSPSHGKIR